MIIFETKFGSHLYGLATEQSDMDFKGIILPTKTEILLGKAKYHKEYNTGPQHSKNASTDVDKSYYTLQYFIELACKGDTVAIDMLHGSSSSWIHTSDVWKHLHENRSKFYTKNMKAYLGYCKKQAAKYGIKGSRLGELERIINILDQHDDNLVVGDIAIATSDIVKWIEFKGNVYLEIAGSKFQDNLKLFHLKKVLKQMFAEYGERTVLAKQNLGVDWKAVGHAMRAGLQMRDIYKDGTFGYPLKESAYLMDIKLGKVPFLEVEEHLTALIAEVTQLAERSTLPDNVDTEYWDSFLADIHYRIIHGNL
jgi:hypothetical protein